MNLSFKSHFLWPGRDGQPEPTRFGEQILNAITANPVAIYPDAGTKLHTIRRAAPDGTCRYRKGMPLHMVTGPRFKPERFAVAECTGVQPIKIGLMPGTNTNGSPGYFLMVFINNKRHFNPVQLAQNDGLTLDQFTSWFMLDLIQHGNFRGHIIHWTDLRY